MSSLPESVHPADEFTHDKTHLVEVTDEAHLIPGNQFPPELITANYEPEPEVQARLRHYGSLVIRQPLH